MFSKLFNKNKIDKGSSKEEVTFAFFRVVEEGKTYIYRSRNNMQEYAKSGKYPYQIGIAAPLNKDQDGFPTKEENEQLLTMEQILVKEFDKDDIALFVGAIIGDGMKELVFYTGNHLAAAKVFERMRDQIKHHKLQFFIKEDQKWDTYKILSGK